MTVVLEGRDLVLGYQRATVVHGVSVRLEPGVVTALIGPNGSGKSTVLRSLARLHRIEAGSVHVDDVDAAPLSAKEFARRVTLLSQSRPHPSGLGVRDVVAFGRHPHRGRFSGVTDADRAAIDRAMAVTGIDGMADRPVDQLARRWIDGRRSRYEDQSRGLYGLAVGRRALGSGGRVDDRAGHTGPRAERAGIAAGPAAVLSCWGSYTRFKN